MDLVDVFKRRWRKFKGHQRMYDAQGELESTSADIEFKKALARMQNTRVRFDIRTPSEPAPSNPPSSISGLNAKLNTDDKLMTEAINALEDTDTEDH